MQKTDFGKLTWSNPSGKINAGKLISSLFWILFVINLFYEKSVFRVYASVQVPPPPDIVKSKIFLMIDTHVHPFIWRNGQVRNTIIEGINWLFLYFKKKPKQYANLCWSWYWLTCRLQCKVPVDFLFLAMSFDLEG